MSKPNSNLRPVWGGVYIFQNNLFVRLTFVISLSAYLSIAADYFGVITTFTLAGLTTFIVTWLVGSSITIKKKDRVKQRRFNF